MYMFSYPPDPTYLPNLYQCIADCSPTLFLPVQLSNKNAFHSCQDGSLQESSHCIHLEHCLCSAPPAPGGPRWAVGAVDRWIIFTSKLPQHLILRLTHSPACALCYGKSGKKKTLVFWHSEDVIGLCVLNYFTLLCKEQWVWSLKYVTPCH